MPFNSLDFNTLKKIPPYSFWFFIVFLGIFTVYFFYQCYKNFIAARKIEDTPTAKIRSAPQGYVELEGIQRCLPNQLTYGFLSGLPCTWYQYAISHYNNKRWRLIEHGSSNNFFLLDDGTGVCLVDPNQAEITTTIKDGWYGFHLHPQGKPKNLISKMLSSLWGNYRYQEWRMEEGNPLYALGNFKTASEYNTLFFQSARFKKEVAALIKQWKKNKTTLLAEFDRDQDGKISALEWEAVRKKAQKTIEQKWSFTGALALNILSAEGLNNEPFILATRQQKKLIGRLKLAATAWLIVYVLSIAFMLWLLSVYLN